MGIWKITYFGWDTLIEGSLFHLHISRSRSVSRIFRKNYALWLINIASDIFSIHRFAIYFNRRANSLALVTPTSLRSSYPMIRRTTPLISFLAKVAPILSGIPLNFWDPLCNFLAALLIFWCRLIFTQTEWFVKLLRKDMIPAKFQGGLLCCHRFASDIEQDNILIISDEKPDIIVLLFKKNLLLYEIIIGRNKGLCPSFRTVWMFWGVSFGKFSKVMLFHWSFDALEFSSIPSLTVPNFVFSVNIFHWTILSSTIPKNTRSCWRTISSSCNSGR